MFLCCKPICQRMKVPFYTLVLEHFVQPDTMNASSLYASNGCFSIFFRCQLNCQLYQLHWLTIKSGPKQHHLSILNGNGSLKKGQQTIINEPKQHYKWCKTNSNPTSGPIYRVGMRNIFNITVHFKIGKYFEIYSWYQCWHFTWHNKRDELKFNSFIILKIFLYGKTPNKINMSGSKHKTKLSTPTQVALFFPSRVVLKSYDKTLVQCTDACPFS